MCAIIFTSVARNVSLLRNSVQFGAKARCDAAIYLFTHISIQSKRTPD